MKTDTNMEEEGTNNIVLRVSFLKFLPSRIWYEVEIHVAQE